MAITYFGNDVAGDGTSGLSGYIGWNDGTNTVFTCPGTGKQNVAELAWKVYVTSGNANVRCAIYNSDGSTLLMQGSAEINVTETDTNGTWKTHTSFVDSAGNAIATPQLDGGSNYILAASGDGTTLRQRRTAVTSGYSKFAIGDYTSSNFPSSVPPPSSGTNLAVCRCGVEPAASSGISIPVLQSSYRRRRS